MTVSKYGISRCGLCKFYRHEGRRDGQCSQLDVSVSSDWKACCLGASPFQTLSSSTVRIAKKSSSTPSHRVKNAAIYLSEAAVAATYS